MKDNGYEPLKAPDGLTGLETALREQPDLILLDLMMPHKSGLALLADFGKSRTLKKIPVIMVTGVTGETGIDLDSFLDRDASGDPVKKPDAYLAKPVDPDELIQMVKRFLE